MVSTAGTTITSAVGFVWDMITANQLLTFFLGTTVLSIGFGFFKKAKRTAK